MQVWSSQAVCSWSPTSTKAGCSFGLGIPTLLETCSPQYHRPWVKAARTSQSRQKRVNNLASFGRLSGRDFFVLLRGCAFRRKLDKALRPAPLKLCQGEREDQSLQGSAEDEEELNQRRRSLRLLAATCLAR